MSVPQFYDVQVGLNSRVLLLESRLRELKELRRSPLCPPDKQARVDSEIEIVNLALSHYLAAGELELLLDRSDIDHLDS